MKGNKTTILGALTLAIGLLNALYEYLSGQPVNMVTLGLAVSTGTSSLFSKDHNVTGGTIAVPTISNPPSLESK